MVFLERVAVERSLCIGDTSGSADAVVPVHSFIGDALLDAAIDDVTIRIIAQLAADFVDQHKYVANVASPPFMSSGILELLSHHVFPPH